MSLIETNRERILLAIVNHGHSHHLASVGLLGDLALHLPGVFQGLSQHHVSTIKSLVTKGQSSEDKKLKAISLWAAEQLLNVCNNNNDALDDSSEVVKKARVEEEEVFYSVNVTVTNNQYITQNMETEHVTIRLSRNNDVKPVVECSNVEATVRLPPPKLEEAHDEMIQDDLTIIRRQRQKRTHRSWIDDEKQEKRWKYDL